MSWVICHVQLSDVKYCCTKGTLSGYKPAINFNIVGLVQKNKNKKLLEVVVLVTVIVVALFNAIVSTKNSTWTKTSRK